MVTPTGCTVEPHWSTRLVKSGMSRCVASENEASCESLFRKLFGDDRL